MKNPYRVRVVCVKFEKSVFEKVIRLRNSDCCRNAYLASFPYGQCMDWTTHVDQCPGDETANSTVPNLCSGYYTCGYGLTYFHRYVY